MCKEVLEFYAMNKEEFQRIWLKYLEKEATETEVSSLLAFIREGTADDFLKEFVTHLDPNAYEQIKLPEQDWQNLWHRIKRQTAPAESKLFSSKRSGVHRILPVWTRYAGYAAAAVLIFIFSSRMFLSSDSHKNIKKNKQQVVAVEDVKAPHSVHAVLTLANGSKIILDNIQNGEVARQGNAHIIKQHDGQLVYNGNVSTNTAPEFNTLTVPRGSKIIELVLADGTKVVLNAASSLTYPTYFTGKERKVEITGEAYFEVARNASMPFIVERGDARIEVLGTHFNINAYDDEDMINVTLLEGSVSVSHTGLKDNLVLKPGEMAQIDDKMQLLKNVDIEEVVAWRQGKFKFGEYANIGTVMRQISRWYDVSVEYRGEVQGHIGGGISREVNVSEVLHLLEMTGAVKFSFDGKTIIVMPK